MLVHRDAMTDITAEEGSPKEVAITKKLLKLITVNLQPISIVKVQGFQEFVQELDPRYAIPSKRSLMRTNLPKLYEKAKDNVKVALAEARQSHPKQQGFSHHLEEKENLDFFRNLRVTKDTFQLLLGIVDESYKPICDRGTPLVSSKECVQLGLWYLGNKATYREIDELFGLSKVLYSMPCKFS
ncbi:hypothetical protein Pcinc_007775 [Petrolisthes cinctipes]|uniref:Uncharacterized protein n=1 Tax=Petrolisthes cinctipes TaxID=88211 RepID=A0AAE1L049_PETCI|nr:hypothetical protein Pcinc_007775 [Petrolisthes cinctipes]